MQGDGTTSCVLFVGELLKYAERYISEGVHPRIIADGFELAKTAILPFLDSFKAAKPEPWKDRELLCSVARTSLRTKLQPDVRSAGVDVMLLLCASLSQLAAFFFFNSYDGACECAKSLGAGFTS